MWRSLGHEDTSSPWPHGREQNVNWEGPASDSIELHWSEDAEHQSEIRQLSQLRFHVCLVYWATTNYAKHKLLHDQEGDEEARCRRKHWVQTGWPLDCLWQYLQYSKVNIFHAAYIITVKIHINLGIGVSEGWNLRQCLRMLVPSTSFLLCHVEIKGINQKHKSAMLWKC